MTAREQIYAQASPETGTVQPQAAEESAPENTTPPSADPVNPPVEELAEPDESQFEDPAEYRQALKDFGAKSAEKKLQEKYEKQLDGLYKDLRKQRGSKRELKDHIGALESKIEAIVGRLEGGNELREPQPQEYGHDPVAFAKAKSAYDLLQWQRAQDAKTAERSTRAEQASYAQREWAMKMEAERSVDPGIDATMQRIAAEGIGAHIKAPAIEAIRQSAIGVKIYRHLGDHPDIAEEIEDMDPRTQVMAIKQLEAYVYSNLTHRSAGASAPQSAPVLPPMAASAPQAPAPARKAPPAPPTRAAGGSHTAGSNKPLTESASFEDYMAKRAGLKKQGKW